MKPSSALAAIVTLLAMPAFGQEAESGSAAGGASAQDLAQQLANPVSSLISVPLQLNVDRQVGTEDTGERLTLNIQPVIPIRLNDDWNLISRTILPLIDQTGIAPGSGSQNGLGDVLQSAFFSPVAPTSGGWIWGAGPALLMPTGSDDRLTADKWAAGPTAVFLKQEGPWTYGALVNHLWSFAGEDERSHINSTFMQPFVSFATPTGLSYTLNAETTYDHRTDQWTAPVFLGFSQVTRIGSQMIQLSAGLRYYLDSPASGPDGLGFRLNVVLLYPK